MRGDVTGKMAWLAYIRDDGVACVMAWQVGCSNINAWIFTLTYGFCFGVELTMNSVAARYFYQYQVIAHDDVACAMTWHDDAAPRGSGRSGPRAAGSHIREVVHAILGRWYMPY